MKNKIGKAINGIYNRWMLSDKGVIWERNININGRIYIRKDSGGILTIGKNVTINSAAEANPIGSGIRTTIWLLGGSIYIGDNVGISNSAFVSQEEIIIKDNVYIGGGCKIYDTDFHSVDYSERVEMGDVGSKHGRVIIEEGVFIGAGCTILKGVTIGHRSVIGAGSIVSRDIPSYQIWAGNPVKYIGNVRGGHDKECRTNN